MSSKLTVEQANAFLAGAFNGREDQGLITEMQDGRTVASLEISPFHLRPGGYVSGPTQMAIADMVAYMAIMTRMGEQPMAVTTNLNINFLRPCIGNKIIADGRLMKLGQTLAIVEVDVRVEGTDQITSHAIATYALPKQ